MEKERHSHFDDKAFGWSELLKEGLGEEALVTLAAMVKSVGLNALTAFQSQEQRLKAAHTAAEEGQLSLVLGAGVSMEYGIPSWYQLLQRLIVGTVTDQPQESDRFLADAFIHLFNPDPLVTARYLKSRLHNDSVFADSVRSALYATFEDRMISPLMQQVVALCTGEGGRAKADSVISYNYDDILERHLDEAGEAGNYDIISEGHHRSRQRCLQIYHVHGFLPSRDKHKQFERITFSEDEYHQQYYDSFTWSNLVQINTFRERSCLFIGSSMTDPDTRRLLDVARGQRNTSAPPHFAVMIRHNSDTLAATIQNQLRGNPVNEVLLKQVVSRLQEYHSKFIQADLASLGVETLWVNSPTEIPQLIHGLRSA